MRYREKSLDSANIYIISNIYCQSRMIYLSNQNNQDLGTKKYVLYTIRIHAFAFHLSLSSPMLTNLTSMLTNLTSMLTNLTPMLTNLTPMLTNLTPMLTNLTPMLTNLTPMLTNLTPMLTKLTSSKLSFTFILLKFCKFLKIQREQSKPRLKK